MREREFKRRASRKTSRIEPEQAKAVLAPIFRVLFQHASDLFPQIPQRAPELHITPTARTLDPTTGTFRSYAYYQVHKKKGPIVAASPDLALSPDRARAVLAHELGHYIDDWVTDDRGPRAAAALFSGILGEPASQSHELLADQLGSLIVGGPIGYDSAYVQTVDPTRIKYSPRPNFLPL